MTFKKKNSRTGFLVVLQDPIINITELKEIHSEINLTVPDPILLPNLHDGLEAVRLHFRADFIIQRLLQLLCEEQSWDPVLSALQQNAKKRKLEDGDKEDIGE